MRILLLLFSLFHLVIIGFAVTAYSDNLWATYTTSNQIGRIAAYDDYIWCSTQGGVVRWDTRNKSFIKYLNTDGIVKFEGGPIVVDNKGIVWLQAYGSILQYDGLAWKYCFPSSGVDFNIENDSSLWIVNRNGSVTSINGDRTTYLVDGLTFKFKATCCVVDDDGLKWFGSLVTPEHNGGVWTFDGNNWFHYTTGNSLIDNSVWDIYIDKDNIKWFVSQKKIARFDGTTWTTYSNPALLDTSISSIVRDSKGVIWITDGYSIYSFDGSIWTDHTPPQEISGNYYRNVFKDITVGKNDVVWCASIMGLLRYNGDSWQNWVETDGLYGNSVGNILIDSKNRKWFSCDGSISYGISCLDNNSWMHFSEGNSVRFSFISSIHEDLYGLFWVLDDNGAHGFNGESWRTYNDIHGKTSLIDRDNKLWIGGTNNIYRYNGISWDIFPVENVNGRNEVRCAAVDSTNIKWFGTNNGIIKFDGEQWITYTISDGLSYDVIDVITVDKNNTIWTGNFKSEEGIMSFDGKSWYNHTLMGGPVGSIYCMMTDHDNVLWIGTQKGIWSYDGTSWEDHTEESMPITKVQTMAIDHNNVKWFSMWNAGICCFDGKIWTTFNTENSGLCDNNVNAIAVDKNNTIWFGTDNGVSKYTGEIITTSVDENETEPEALLILKAYPNPFNPTTTIEFALPDADLTTLTIYNMSGQKVRELAADYMTAGTHRLQWDGKDNSGSSVSAGIYIARLKSGEITATGKLVMVK